jgi:LEA14-like dessication related protein
LSGYGWQRWLRRRRRRRCGRLARLETALFLARTGSLEPPPLSVIGVEIVRGDLFEQRFKARMRVQNPNDRSIAVRGVSYILQIGGEELGRGLSGSSFTVPASGEAEFDMLVTANLAGTVMRLLERARSDGLPDSLSYRLRGEVKLAEGLVRTIPFDEKGSVRLR